MRKLTNALLTTAEDLWATHATEPGWWHHDLQHIAKYGATATQSSSHDITTALRATYADPSDKSKISKLIGYCLATDAETLCSVVDNEVPNRVDELPDFYLKLLLLFKIIRIRNSVFGSTVAIEYDKLFGQYTIIDLIPGPMIFHERVYIAEKSITPAAAKFRSSCHYGRRSVQHARGATVPLRIAYFCAEHAPTREKESFRLEKIINILSKFRNSGHMTLDADVDLVLEKLKGETGPVSLDYIWSLDSGFEYGLNGLFHPQQIKKDGFFTKLWMNMTKKPQSNEDVELGAVFHDLVHQKIIVGVKFDTYQTWIRALTQAGTGTYVPKVMHDICRLVYLANQHRPNDLLNMAEILDTVDIHYPTLIKDIGLHTWSMSSKWAKEPMPWWVYILAAMHVCALNGFDVILTLDHMNDDIQRWMNLYPVEQGTNLCQKNQESLNYSSQLSDAELVN